MFLIVNDGRILRARGERITLGGAPDATVRLDGKGIEPYQCELVAEDNGNWLVRNLSDQRVRINGVDLPRNGATKVSQPCDLQTAQYVIQVREASANGAISQRLRQKLYNLEADLHNAVLDRVRHAAAEGPKQERKRIEAELERQFEGLRLEPELETYLATQALSELLLNRVHGYGHQDRSSAAQREAANTRFAPLLDRTEECLKLGEDRTPAERTERIEVLLPWVLHAYGNLVTPDTRRSLAIALLREQLVDLMFGLGPLEDLLKASDINDIMVLPSGQIFVERNGQMQDSGRKMLSPIVSRRIVERIVSREGRRIDQSSPMVDARVADGSRLNAIIEPIAVQGPTLTIRRFAEKKLAVADLVTNGTLTQAAADFLTAAIVARKSLVISGGTGSGKTTLLNALASYIPASERIITVEDTAEIQLPQTHVVTLQAKPPNLEGESAITIRQLVRNTLRMRPDRIIVGECRGGEALDMLQAMNTGHDGSMTTIHANSAADAVRRLEVMAMEAEGINLPSRALREQIVGAVDVIVQISRVAHRARRVISICEVVDIDEESGSILLEEIYTYRKRKGKTAFSRPSLAFTGYVPTFMEEVLHAGAELTCLD